MKSSDLARSDQFPEEIRTFFAGADRTNFFTLPEWFRLIAAYGLDAGSEAFVSVDSDSAIGIACRYDGRVLRSCTNVYSCNFDLFAGRPDPQSLRNFIRALLVAAGPLARVRLEGLDPGSAHFSAILNGIRAADFVAKPYFAWANWFEPTAGMDFQQFVSTRSSRLRNTWSRKRGMVMKTSSAAFRLYDRDENIEPFISAYERVREQSWKKPEPFPGFIPALIRLAASLRALRCGLLTVDGVAAAAQFWILWEGHATIYKLVHAEKFAEMSPGTLLTMEMMRRVLEEDRPLEVDFGRGDDDYKKSWLTKRRELWGIEAANPRSWRGLPSALRICAAGLRRKSKDVRH